MGKAASQEADAIPTSPSVVPRGVPAHQDVVEVNGWIQLAEASEPARQQAALETVAAITKDVPEGVFGNIQGEVDEDKIVAAVRSALRANAKVQEKQAPSKYELDVTTGKFKFLKKVRVGSVDVSLGQIDLKQLAVVIGASAYACAEIKAHGYAFAMTKTSIETCVRSAIANARSSVAEKLKAAADRPRQPAAAARPV